MESTPKSSSSQSENPRVMRSVQPEPRFAPPPPPPAGPSISVGDIYYTLFRHKWKILICTVVGLGAAAAFYKLVPVPFRSQATLLVKYVAEKRDIDAIDGEELRAKNADQPVINAEVQIMTSFDLMKLVAADFGPDKIVPGAETGAAGIQQAAGALSAGFKATSIPRNNYIMLELAHPDATVVQPALAALIDRYLKRHQEIHRSTGMIGSLLAQETDQARARLARTDEQLRAARNRAGVISLETSKANLAAQITSLRNQILESEAQLVERKTVLESQLKAAAGANVDAVPEPTPEQLRQYQALLRREAGLQKQEQDLLAVFTDDNVRVKQVRDQLSAVEKSLSELETANPKLALRARPPAGADGTRGGYDPQAEAAAIAALEARIRILTTQLEAVRTEATGLDQMELEILALTRLREQQEASYRDLAASMDRMRINDALGSGSVTNINVVETPTPPFKDAKKTQQIAGGIAVGGLALGLAWAFVIELFLDRSVRRPADVKRNLRLPLFLSIPRLSKKQLQVSADLSRPALPGPKGGSTPPSSVLAVAGQKEGQLAPWESGHPLHAFHETLRDRLISYFESVNLTHKPKLVAVTGLGGHAGVTTTAAGLAASLSETGDGNVLLVDMTVGQGSAQQFYQGKAVCGLEEILDARDSAQVENNLYVVGQEPGGERLSRILPHRFNKIVPKLKASNFDYIIFDMPPVSQISITPRLAGFMDMTLLVLESEKTDKEVAAHAADLLSQSKTHVGVVLNKTKSYIPGLLHQDREFLHGV